MMTPYENPPAYDLHEEIGQTLGGSSSQNLHCDVPLQVMSKSYDIETEETPVTLPQLPVTTSTPRRFQIYPKRLLHAFVTLVAYAVFVIGIMIVAERKKYENMCMVSDYVNLKEMAAALGGTILGIYGTFAIFFTFAKNIEWKGFVTFVTIMSLGIAPLSIPMTFYGMDSQVSECMFIEHGKWWWVVLAYGYQTVACSVGIIYVTYKLVCILFMKTNEAFKAVVMDRNFWCCSF